MDEIIHLKLLAESDFKNNYPGLGFFVQKYLALSSEVSVLKTELKHTKNEFENQKNYLRILKEQDETLKIKKFYYNEYEILPLWYKRFGHILKVITGKRTYRSLFDNNIKKYKD